MTCRVDTYVFSVFSAIFAPVHITTALFSVVSESIVVSASSRPSPPYLAVVVAHGCMNCTLTCHCFCLRMLQSAFNLQVYNVASIVLSLCSQCFKACAVSFPCIVGEWTHCALPAFLSSVCSTLTAHELSSRASPGKPSLRLTLTKVHNVTRKWPTI